MDVVNEILDAIEIIVDKKVRDISAQIYPGVCKSVSGNSCVMSINGRNNTVQFYGSTPTVGSIYRVFVPNGNMSMAFIIANNDDSPSSSATSYTELANKPSINNVILEGNKTSAQLGIVDDKTYVYTQTTSTAVWNIQHNLNKYPSVTVVDSGGSVVVGETVYIDNNNIQITFSFVFSGKAYCN